MNTEIENKLLHGTAIAHAIAPEDIQPDDYLFVLSQLWEVFPIGALFEANWRDIELIRVHCLPEADRAPVRVLEICLPAILVRDKDGKHNVLDVRRFRFARLTQRFGRKAFKRLRQPAKSGKDAAAESAECDS